MKNYVNVFFTVFVFLLLGSSVSPVIGVNKEETDDSLAQARPVVSPSARAASASASPSATVASASAKSTAKPAPVSDVKKFQVYSGTLSAAPSAVGRFLLKSQDKELTVDVDKKYTIVPVGGAKKPASLQKIDLGANLSVVGLIGDKNIVTAKVIYISGEKKKRVSTAGVVKVREASGSAFILTIEDPESKESQKYVLNANSKVRVKGQESGQLSDVKLDDKVVFTFTENSTEPHTINSIFSIPGKASGILKELRDNGTASSASPSATIKSASPSATVRSTPKATN